MDRNHWPHSPNGDRSSSHFPPSGSWPEMDLSGPSDLPSVEAEPRPVNWEADWIDLGGEG